MDSTINPDLTLDWTTMSGPVSGRIVGGSANAPVQSPISEAVTQDIFGFRLRCAYRICIK